MDVDPEVTRLAVERSLIESQAPHFVIARALLYVGDCVRAATPDPVSEHFRRYGVIGSLEDPDGLSVQPGFTYVLDEVDELIRMADTWGNPWPEGEQNPLSRLKGVLEQWRAGELR